MAQHAAESRAGAHQAELAALARSRQLGADPCGAAERGRAKGGAGRILRWSGAAALQEGEPEAAPCASCAGAAWRLDRGWRRPFPAARMARAGAASCELLRRRGTARGRRCRGSNERWHTSDQSPGATTASEQPRKAWGCWASDHGRFLGQSR
ncbi:hypothetical protein PVAP13_1NG057500 [Panicum virgatum]|uniref:Uncharacterized protein n=1 Tax=Panicum virgatum TaxID=38727 RepID=A0A8T0WNV4_PANVG|nr:hypothetical protein PVAP13_1NG057500 [Panicum virgatum]